MGQHQLHLVEVAGPMPPTGGRPFALRVDDLDEIVGTLRSRGVKVDAVPEVPGAGRQAFLADPAGNLIELNQPT
jgi:catechol 2,3-dioxygenase-like lactoylglutathione lyase family enzyme